MISTSVALDAQRPHLDQPPAYYACPNDPALECRRAYLETGQYVLLVLFLAVLPALCCAACIYLSFVHWRTCITRDLAMVEMEKGLRLKRQQDSDRRVEAHLKHLLKTAPPAEPDPGAP